MSDFCRLIRDVGRHAEAAGSLITVIKNRGIAPTPAAEAALDEIRRGISAARKALQRLCEECDS